MPYQEHPQQQVLNNVKITGDLNVVGRLVQNATPVALVSSGGAISLDCSKGDNFLHNPTEDTTISPINLAPGQYITIMVVTINTTTRNLTFGGNSKSTGVLASGATSGKTFIVTFLSDGTNLYEVSRTTAM
jgi:hypothetical protein